MLRDAATHPPDPEAGVRRRLATRLAAPDLVPRLAPLPAAAVVRVRAALLSYLDASSVPVASALDAVAKDLPAGDEGRVVCLWARGEARAAGASVPFDAAGLDALLAGGASSKP